MIVTRTELAEILGCSVAEVAVYETEGMPVLQPERVSASAKFDSGACITWYIARRVRLSTLH